MEEVLLTGEGTNMNEDGLKKEEQSTTPITGETDESPSSTPSTPEQRDEKPIRRRTDHRQRHRSTTSSSQQNSSGDFRDNKQSTTPSLNRSFGQQSSSYDDRDRDVRERESRSIHHNTSSHKDKYGHRNHNKQEIEPKKTVDEMSLVDLNVYARQLGIVGAALLSKSALITRIKYIEANPDVEIDICGVLEKLPDGFGFLRSAGYEYVSGPDDIYVSPSQVRRFNLRTGDMITGVIRKPKDGEKYFALLKVKSVNDQDPSVLADRCSFDRLTPMHPNKKCILEFNPTAIATRVMDLFTPIGKGQRALLVAPPRVGKTVLLKELAQSFLTNHPEMTLVILLVDERPEEVADMRKMVKGTSAEVVSSTFDESAERHVQVAEIVLERAKRLVENGKDVVIFLDSITRLARAYNTIAPASGKVLTGGIDANALQHPKRIFGAARALEEGGSLTIIGTALIDTGSRMDEVIFEEFKGTGNSEIHMTRKLSHRRIYPAFDLLVSGTRREDLLQDPEELNKVWVMQKLLATMNTAEGMEFIIEKMKRFKTNQEFLESMNKKQ